MMKHIEIDDFVVYSSDFGKHSKEVFDEFKRLHTLGLSDSSIKTSYYSSKFQHNVLFRKSSVELTEKQKEWADLSIICANKYSSMVSKKIFTKFSIDDAKMILAYNTEKNGIELAQHYLAKMGIFLVFVKPPEGSKIDGATFLTAEDNVAIALSLRFERYDHFWFTLMHEISHIILHDDHLRDGILSDSEHLNSLENEANHLARDLMVPPNIFRTLKSKNKMGIKELSNEAEKINIHKALLAGIIRNATKSYWAYSDVVNEYKIDRESMYE